MRSDLTTLEMLKEVRIKAHWSLVRKVTHLALAVAIGYYWGTHEKSDIEKVYQTVNQRRGEILEAMRKERANARPSTDQAAGRSSPSDTSRTD